jgi:hypothetical protein
MSMLKLLIAILFVDPCSSTPTAADIVDPYFNTLFTPPTCANDCQTTAIPAAQICKACDISDGGRQVTCAIPGTERFFVEEIAACITCQAYKRQHGISLLTKYTCDKPYLYYTCSMMREYLGGCANACNEADYRTLLWGMAMFLNVPEAQAMVLYETCTVLAPPPECFPSEALVTMADGTPRRLDALRAGDSIVAARADGTLTTDTVSTLSLADADVQGTTFVVLTTASGRNLTLTPTHHVPVGAACCADLKQAKDIAVGETVYEAVSVSDAVRATKVKEIGTATKPGLHSPVLSHGTMPIVNGVATSFDALHNVRLASYNASYGLPCMQDVLTTAP